MNLRFYYSFVLISTVLFFASARMLYGQNTRPFSSTQRVSIQLPASDGTASTLAIDSTLGNRIADVMNLTYNKTLPFNKHGVTASVIAKGRQWNFAVGTADDISPMDTTLLFEVASNTKTFVTSIIMKLQDSGILSIKDSIYKWLPKKYPNVDSAITIEMLLNHSSGIFDIENDDSTFALLTDEYINNPGKTWTPDELLMNYVKKPNFKPGSSYKYSNTNFILLGLIAEQATHSTLQHLVHSNCIDRFKLNHTFFGGQDSITIPFAHNWSPADSSNPAYDYFNIDKTAQLTGAWSIGNICSTPSDLCRWGQALYLGQIVSDSALKQMEKVHRLKDGSYYGLGTVYLSYNGHSFYGHDGSLIGFKSLFFTNPKDSVSLSICINWERNYSLTDIYINDYLLAIFNEIYKPAANAVNIPSLASHQTEIFPNPASHVATIALNTDRPEIAPICFYNAYGMKITTMDAKLSGTGQDLIPVDISSFSNGIYYYTIETTAGILRGKLIVKH